MTLGLFLFYVTQTPEFPYFNLLPPSYHASIGGEGQILYNGEF